VRHSAIFRVASSLQTITRMGAAWATDADTTSETLCLRRRAARRRIRPWPVPFEPLETAVDIEPVESDTDFGDDDITIPEPIRDVTPAWAPADIGQSLIDEWDATNADTLPARSAS
jgi:hypothetical protein